VGYFILNGKKKCDEVEKQIGVRYGGYQCNINGMIDFNYCAFTFPA